jgi:general secretion pathway protein G
MRTSTRTSRLRGFTLIEMIVVVLIVSILASAAMPMAALHKRRTQEVELRQALRTIRSGLDAYKKAWDDGRIEKRVEDTGYPPRLEDLVTGVKDIKSAKGLRIYFLRRLPRDPFAEPDVPAAQTWGLRSYDSSPDSPSPGADVFDVYSTADGTGLDGTPYQQW